MAFSRIRKGDFYLVYLKQEHPVGLEEFNGVFLSGAASGRLMFTLPSAVVYTVGCEGRHTTFSGVFSLVGGPPFRSLMSSTVSF